MDASTRAVIYLSEHRGCTQSDLFRSYHTFNFDQYQNEHRKQFRGLTVLNDETLKEKLTVPYNTTKNEAVLLVPVVGSLQYKTNAGLGVSLDVGQSQILFLERGSQLDITNPYEYDLINFLQIRFAVTSDQANKPPIKTDFNLDINVNQLIPMSQNCMIGKFDGREDCVYKTRHGKDVFLFVLEGAFEAQNRLMEARDGLGLSNVEEVEFEALSNGAIMIVIEV